MKRPSYYTRVAMFHNLQLQKSYLKASLSTFNNLDFLVQQSESCESTQSRASSELSYCPRGKFFTKKKLITSSPLLRVHPCMRRYGGHLFQKTQLWCKNYWNDTTLDSHEKKLQIIANSVNEIQMFNKLYIFAVAFQDVCELRLKVRRHITVILARTLLKFG